jgi:hypothetical protein
VILYEKRVLVRLPIVVTDEVTNEVNGVRALVKSTRSVLLLEDEGNPACLAFKLGDWVD